METRAGDPGAFARFDLSRVDSPAFVVDAARLRHNLRVLADVGERSGAKVLAALKAFSMWSTAPIIGEYLDGVCASGLWEARLAGEPARPLLDHGKNAPASERPVPDMAQQAVPGLAAIHRAAL